MKKKKDNGTNNFNKSKWLGEGDLFIQAKIKVYFRNFSNTELHEIFHSSELDVTSKSLRKELVSIE